MHKFILYMYRCTYITHVCVCVCDLRAHTHPYGNLTCYACLMRTRIHHYCQENKNKARRNRGEYQCSIPQTQTQTQTQTHRLTHTHLRAFMSTHKVYKWYECRCNGRLQTKRFMRLESQQPPSESPGPTYNTTPKKKFDIKKFDMHNPLSTEGWSNLVNPRSASWERTTVFFTLNKERRSLGLHRKNHLEFSKLRKCNFSRTSLPFF